MTTTSSKKDMMDMLGEHKLSFVIFTSICLAIAIYCVETAGSSRFGDPCTYQFQCADLVQYDLECLPVFEEDLCVIRENDDGECPQHTRHEEGHICLPIEGMRTINTGEDRIAPRMPDNLPSSALDE